MSSKVGPVWRCMGGLYLLSDLPVSPGRNAPKGQVKFMSRSIALVMLGGLLLAACGDAPAGSGSSATTDAPDTTAAAPSTIASAPTPAAPLATYRYTMTYAGIDRDGTEIHFSVSGAVDGDRRVGEIRYAEIDDGPMTVIVQSPVGVAVQAPSSDLVSSDVAIDPMQWYDIAVFEEDGADAFFLATTPTAASLWELLGVEPERSSGDAGVVERALVDETHIQPLRKRNTMFALFGRSDEPLELATETDPEGNLSNVTLTSTDPDEPGTISIVITDRGEPVDIFVPDKTIPVPTEEQAPPRTVPPVTVPPVTIGPDVDGVLFRLSTAGGWELPEKPARELSLTADGDLVRAINPDVFASADDFTVLQVNPLGVERLVAVVEDSGLLDAPGLLDGGAGVSPTDVTTTLWMGGWPVLSMDRVGEVDGYTEEQLEARDRFGEVIARLEDPSWLGDDIVVDWEPWIPETLTVFAGDVSPRGGVPPDAPFAPWPLDTRIVDLASDTRLNPYDEEELVLCLTGEQVAPVWGLLTGVNNAYLRVDDGTQWELTYSLAWPGYEERGRGFC